MQFFDDFDVEEKTNSEVELTLLERGVVVALSALIIRAAKKARKAKNYGDLYKIMGIIEDRMESIGDKLESVDDDSISEEQKESVVKEQIIEIQQLVDEI